MYQSKAHALPLFCTAWSFSSLGSVEPIKSFTNITDSLWVQDGGRGVMSSICRKIPGPERDMWLGYGWAEVLTTSPFLLQIIQNFSGTELRTYAMWKWEEARNSSFELVHEITLGTGMILARPWDNQRGEDGRTHKVVLCFSDVGMAYPAHHQKFQKLLNSWKKQATDWTGLLPEAFCSCKQMPWINLIFTLGREERWPWISTNGKMM